MSPASIHSFIHAYIHSTNIFRAPSLCWSFCRTLRNFRWIICCWPWRLSQRGENYCVRHSRDMSPAVAQGPLVLPTALLAKSHFSPTDEKTQVQKGHINTARKRQKQDLHSSKVHVLFLSNRLQKERVTRCNRNEATS